MTSNARHYLKISRLFRGEQSWTWAPSLLARLALGIFFAISGGNKVFNEKDQELLYKTIADKHHNRQTGIP
jgi:hypothetical protein